MTSWYITMFSSKIKELDTLYRFWLTLLEKDDSLYICYFGIALLQMYKGEIESQNMLSFPNVFKKIMVTSNEVLVALLADSDQIRENMPITAEMVLKKYNMFSLANTDSFVKILEKTICLLVLPREILLQTYPHDLVCECRNQKNCKLKRLNHILLDCRPSKEHKLGHFPNSHLLGKSAQYSHNKLKDYPQKFITLRKNCHITLMGNGSKETDSGTVYKLYNSFVLHNFPYVSIVDGGYVACHDFAVQHNYPITSHNPKKCFACNGESKVIIESTLDKFFSLNTLTKKNSLENSPAEDLLKNEKVFLCKLTEEGNINTSEFGLVITPTQILLYNLPRKEVNDVIYINRLLKITSNKNNFEMLTFTFSDTTDKKVFILSPSEVKEFLGKVREKFQSVRQINSNIKKLI